MSGNIKMLFKSIILTAIVFTMSFSAKAQIVILNNEADSLLRLGTNKIYNCQFDEATKIFKEVIDKNPNHPAGYFLDAMVEWWKIQIWRESREHDKPFLAKVDRVLRLCEMLLDRNPGDINAMFFKGGCHGYKGRFYSDRNEWFKAANEGRLGYDLLMSCWQQAPGNHDIMLGTGIYNYFAAAIPEIEPTLKPIIAFFPKGDKVLGILQLTASAKSARYAATEAKVLLMQITYQFEKNYPEALRLSEELYKSYPRNSYFHRFLGKTYVTLGMQKEWETTWRDVVTRSLDKWPGYDRMTAREGLYYVALSLMYQGKWDMSLKYFYKCDDACRAIDKSEQSGFMVKTAMYIGNIYDMQGKRKFAVDQYNKVVAWKDYSGTKEEAKRYLKTPYGH